MIKTRFFVHGIPVAKSRAKRGMFGQAYIPKKTKDWEKIVKLSSIPHRPGQLPQGPIQIQMIFHMPRPKSLPKRVIYHTKRPDADNLAKSVLDALHGSFYRDDAQIFDQRSMKIYARRPGVDIFINELSAEELTEIALNDSINSAEI